VSLEDDVIAGIIALIAYVGSGGVGAAGDITDNQRLLVLVAGIAVLVFGLIELAVARGLFRIIILALLYSPKANARFSRGSATATTY
jgi:cytochrome c biogenesis protein CcdA